MGGSKHWLIRPRQTASAWWFDIRDLPVLLLYAILFHLAHSLAVWWGGPGFFSLWFPAAGIRFALLWVFGARLTLAVVITELLVQLLAGVLRIGEPDWILMAISIARPALVYGLAIAAVRHLTRRQINSLSIPPIPVSFAAVLAPVGAAIAAVPASIFRPELTNVEGAREIVESLSAFATGDLLGVLLIAPPAIFAAELWLGQKRWVRPRAEPAAVVEWTVVLAVPILFVLLLAYLQIGSSGMPIVLAVVWIGLRFGWAAVWAANSIVAGLVFPLTARLIGLEGRLDLHMSVAAVAIAGYVAASFANATSRSGKEIARRDRILYHAERLKTVRVMSVAVIHEVSQPLSTLVLETSHLRQSVERIGDPDLIATAQLVEDKIASLSAMTRRLRDFGSRDDSCSRSVLLEVCLREAVALVSPKRGAHPIRLQLGQAADARIRANPIEVTQAFVNLLRNALHADGNQGSVVVRLSLIGEDVHLLFENGLQTLPQAPGMGVGSVIARVIIEASGGWMSERRQHGDRMQVEVRFPLEQK